MKINGECHCGAISYEAELDPAKGRDLPLFGLPVAFSLGIQNHRNGFRR